VREGAWKKKDHTGQDNCRSILFANILRNDLKFYTLENLIIFLEKHEKGTDTENTVNVIYKDKFLIVLSC